MTMTTPASARAVHYGFNEAEEACDELCDALRDVGVVLPSLGIDLVSCTSEILRPLVDLGRCNVDTARRLTAALKGRTR
ncbi:hypothetical protein ACH4GP_10900 [Streptomyces celluloflavus]|uniref:Uncharacterized protein n=1 Tax=Streptomyces celluloflavus TaxID=58344 RepID=A0ABW7REW6_9ACTN